MAVYYFHLRNGTERLIDPLGRAIDDPNNLDTIALKEVRALIAHDVLNGELDLHQRLEIEDQDGRVVRRVAFSDAIRLNGHQPV